MTRKEIDETYGIGERGEITSLGKFEGEMCYAPYFHSLIGEGFVPDKYHVEGYWYSCFNVNNEDREEFPELNDIYGVICHESDQGFFFCEAHETAKEYQEAEKELEELEAKEETID